MIFLCALYNMLFGWIKKSDFMFFIISMLFLVVCILFLVCFPFTTIIFCSLQYFKEKELSIKEFISIILTNIVCFIFIVLTFTNDSNYFHNIYDMISSISFTTNLITCGFIIAYVCCKEMLGGLYSSFIKNYNECKEKVKK